MARAAAPWGARASAVRDRREAECHGAEHDGRGLREALHSLRFDEMGCLKVAHIVGIFNYLTRVADGFGLELHPALMEAARSGIPLRFRLGPRMLARISHNIDQTEVLALRPGSGFIAGMPSHNLISICRACVRSAAAIFTADLIDGARLLELVAARCVVGEHLRTFT